VPLDEDSPVDDFGKLKRDALIVAVPNLGNCTADL
jgi:hypothetical protein